MKRIGLSLLVIAVVFIALRAIDGLRAERGARRSEVTQTITQSAGGAVELVTPLLVAEVTEVFPMRETRTREVVKQGVVLREDYEEQLTKAETRKLWLIPTEVEVAAASQIETRFIGIFPGRVQAAQVHMTGRFIVPAKVLAARHPGGTTRIAGARLNLSLASLRSLEQISLAQWRDAPLHFEPAAGGWGFETAAATLPGLVVDTPLPFELTLSLRGGSSFTLHPLAERSAAVKLDANWPHADFTLKASSALPGQRTITKTTTHAEWLMTGLSSGLKAIYSADDGGDVRLFERGLSATVGADFIEPVDVFARVERSVKYGVLLIGLSLSLLWLAVARSRVRAHVMHYTLIALNLAIFFLLLLSLAEKVDFALAYGLSAGAVTLLNVAYLSGVMGGLLKALLATLPSAISFVALYALLVSEDSALLLGSLFVFTLLAGLMLFTRKLDWNEVLAAPRPRGA